MAERVAPRCTGFPIARRTAEARGGAAADIENFGNSAHNKSAQTTLEVQQTITKGKPI